MSRRRATTALHRADADRRLAARPGLDATHPWRCTMTRRHTTMPRFVALVGVIAFLAVSPAVGASPAATERQLPGSHRLAQRVLSGGHRERARHVVLRRFAAGRVDLAGRSSNRVGGGARGRRAGARVRRDRLRGRPRPDLGRRRRAAARSAVPTCACTTHRAGRCSRRISRPEWGC